MWQRRKKEFHDRFDCRSIRHGPNGVVFARDYRLVAAKNEDHTASAFSRQLARFQAAFRRRDKAVGRPLRTDLQLALGSSLRLVTHEVHHFPHRDTMFLLRLNEGTAERVQVQVDANLLA